MGLSSETSALLVEAKSALARLRRLAQALASTEEVLADRDDGSSSELRAARDVAYKCRRFLTRLDSAGVDSRAV